MTLIGNSDHILNLLRAQLLRLQKAQHKVGKSSAELPSQEPSAVERLRANSIERDDDAERVTRALVAALLADEIGAELANTVRFQDLVEQVHNLIFSDIESRKLMIEALDQLRRGSNSK